MGKKLSILATLAVLLFSACERQEFGTDELRQSLNLKSSQISTSDQIVPEKMNGQVVLNFRAHLTGDQEVPSRETLATGQALFKLSKSGTELHYKLIVADLDNITMAHIHVAPAGANGPVVAWLYPPVAPAVLIPGTTNGILQEGLITKAKLVGMLSGSEVSDLVDLINQGRTYVNVHTTKYPGGEIRGQIFGNIKPE